MRCIRRCAALARLLIAEPEDELAEVRERILRAVGAERGAAGRRGAGVRRRCSTWRPMRAIR